MKKIILISSIILITCLSFAADLGEYTTAINQRLADSCTDRDTLKGWREGIKEEFGCDLDHLTSVFVLYGYKEVDKDKMMVAGSVTTTGYAYKDKYKVRIVQVNKVIYLMNKDKIIEDFDIIDSGRPKILDGWVGINT